MGVETGMTEVKVSEVAGVLEAGAEAEVTTTVGTVEMTSEIVTDEALKMTRGVGVVVAEAMAATGVDMVGTVTILVHLILLAAASAN